MKSWVKDLALRDFGAGQMSQGYQDILIDIIFDNIPAKNSPRFCVEFGFDGSEISGGYGANTAVLVSKRGWRNLYLDGGNENRDINLHRHFLTSDNIVSVLRQYNVPSEPDYISIDVDSTDLWLFRSILEEYRASVFSVEYNCNFPLSAAITMADGCSWECDRGYGASLKALTMVAEKHGYVLLWVVPRLDAFFIKQELIDDGSPCIAFPLSTWLGATAIEMHPAIRRVERLDCFLDYATFERTGGDLERSRKDARSVCRRWLMQSWWVRIWICIWRNGLLPRIRKMRIRVGLRTRLRIVRDYLRRVAGVR